MPFFILVFYYTYAPSFVYQYTQRKYERGVIFTLGRFWRVKGPGPIIVIRGHKKWYGLTFVPWLWMCRRRILLLKIMLLPKLMLFLFSRYGSKKCSHSG